MRVSIGSFGKTGVRPWSRPGRGRRRPGRAAGITGVAVSLAVALAACTSARAASLTAAASGVPSGMSCAWPSELSAQKNNNYFPDSAAEYFIQPIVASAGTRIVLSGRFPDARYASADVYTPAGVGTSLPDYQIAPRPGSVNPWQRKAAPGGRFTVTIRPDPAPGQANTLPLPAGTTSQHPGYLIYRVYLPAGGDFSAVPVPALTVEQGNAARTLPYCRSHNAPVPLPTGGGSGTPAPTPPPLEFYKPEQSTFNNGGLANVDTSYAIAYLARPPADDVVVVTAKAPTFPPGSHPSPWPGRGDDLRYWSMCVGVGISGVPVVANQLPGGRTDYGCRADQATRLNAAGDYTYVIGGESQRAAISRIPGVTFLPFSTSYPTGLYLLGLRDTLVSSGFTHSPRDVTQANDPAATAAAMGPYYPRTAVCPLATLTAKGPRACLEASGSER
ncbi:MAG: hypothetical protein J2P26_09475 [Nocardiopsaceae bacterium]|nr:hypothetical protein [Nocardiopsaceae bacterium]